MRARCWIAISLAAACTSEARAEEASTLPRRDPAAAQALFEEGRALAKAGRPREACEKFDASQALDPAVGTLFNTAACAVDRGALATGWLRYREAVALAHERGDAREAIASQRATALEGRVPRLLVRLGGRTPGLHVTKDGTELAAGAFDTAIPADPGPVRVAASAFGFEGWSVLVDVVEGRVVRVDIPALKPLPNASAGEAPPAWRRPAALAGLGTGVLALGVATVFGIRAWSAWSDIESTCPAGLCPDESTRAAIQPEHNRASNEAAVATGLAITGAALVALGLVTLMTTPRARPRPLSPVSKIAF